MLTKFVKTNLSKFTFFTPCVEYKVPDTYIR